MKKSNFNPINFYRVIAVLFVFILHSTLFSGKDFPAGHLFNDYKLCFLFALPAWGGCWLLFVLSGYLAGIGFEFYLIHSMVLDRLAKFIGGANSMIQQINIIIVCFLVTCIFLVYHIIFAKLRYKTANKS